MGFNSGFKGLINYSVVLLEVFTELLKITVAWDMTTCCLVICYWRFDGACCLRCS